MIRAVKQHPGVFIGGGITFLLVEHFLRHTKQGTGMTSKASSKMGGGG